jgi:type I restriction enzyme S subunit
MIEGLEPYSEYKNSGQQWLGRVPAHWDLKPGHAAFVPRGIKNTGMKEKTVLSLSYGRIKIKRTDKQHGLVPQTYETYQIVDEGNIVIRGTDLQNDKTSLRVGLSRNRGIISSAYLCFETRRSVAPDYGYQILNTFDLTKAIYRYGSGLRQSLDEGEIRRLPIFIPPLDEQAAIVRFLDYANRKIDGFIRAKRKLIGLLNEQKQAIIRRAVTRGLNPNAPLKPSGIPWLGDIPQHWEVRKLGSLFLRRGSGTTPNGDAYYGGGVPWVMSGDLNDAHVCSTKRTVTESALRQFSALKLYPKGSLLVAMYGATIGKTGLLGVSACSNQACCALASPRPETNPAFAQAAVILARHHLLQLAYGGGQPNINAEVVRSLRVPHPPFSEQNDITKYLASAVIPMDTAIARTEREITLMQEYRTRLTADVVTGKLDVRKAAAKLPKITQEKEVELDAMEETEELGEEI